MSQGGAGGWVSLYEYNKISSNKIPSFPSGGFGIPHGCRVEYNTLSVFSSVERGISDNKYLCVVVETLHGVARFG